MTTVTKEITTTETYVPNVQDKIQRVLYRLEHGEQLISDQLRAGQNFCILGLFTEESGLGNWDDSGAYVVGESLPSCVDLPYAVMDYYGFKDLGGVFDVDDLSNDIKNKISCLLFEQDGAMLANLNLSSVNDLALLVDYPHTNQLLADIIRSGVIFSNSLNKGD